MCLTVQKLEHPSNGGKPYIWAALLIAICFGFQQAKALNPGSVTITNKSGTRFIVDKNDPCDDGPRASYVAYQIRNTSSAVLSNLSATVTGLATGFKLGGTQPQPSLQSIGTLAPGEHVTLFWYIEYPCEKDKTTNIIVTVSDSNPGSESFSNQVTTKLTSSTGSTGEIDEISFGPGIVQGETTYFDVMFELDGNMKKNGIAYFQPAGNREFDASCMQLTRTEVISSELSSVVPVGSTNILSYVAAANTSGGGNKKVKLRFYFKVKCNAPATELAPFAANHTGTVSDSNFKYHNDYAEDDKIVSVPSAFPAPDPCSVGSAAEFASQLTSIGFDSRGDNWSAAWGDYDGDDYPDIFITTHDPNQPNALYRNNRNGTFTKVDTAPFNADMASSLSSTWGDYDNDGDLDLYVANNIGFSNFLYRNEGGGSFTKILGDPIVSYTGYSHGVSWADYDNDGFLDMFVAVYWETAFNLLYHNNGDGTFREVTGNAATNEASRSVCGAWGDFNNDGLIDLFVANTGGQNNSLYQNLGGGQFERITTGAIVNDGGSSVGASWGDYNNDGNLDLYVVNAGGESCFLYKNNGDGSFSRIATGAIVTDTGDAHGSAWADWDNDGDLDLFVARDGRNNSLYRNDGNDVFTSIQNDITDDAGLSFGSAWADFDRDGDLDLFVANRKSTGNFFYNNDKGNCKNWSSINLVGTNSNRSGIGAKVFLTANINGANTTQMREVSAQTGGGTGGQNELKLSFGLGNATTIASITIEWPSGHRQTLSNQPINQHLTIREESTSEVSGMVYFEENISSNGSSGALPAAAQAANYRTAQAGNWSSSATWVGGNIPPTSYINNRSISIEHDVTLTSGGIYMTGNSAIYITNAKLTLSSGNLTWNNGAVSILNGELLLNAGSLDLILSSAYLNVKQSKVTIANGSHYSVGKKRWENAVLQVSGSYDNGGIDTLINVKMLINGNIQNNQFGAMVVNGAVVKSNTGGFQNVAPAQIKGSGLVLWVPNGNIYNYSLWTATIAQYCSPSWATPFNIASGYLPAAKDCSTIADRFVADPSLPVIDRSGWIGIPHARVEFQPGNVVVYADENGYYSAFLPVGTYTAQETPGSNFEPKLPNTAGTQPVTVSAVGQKYQDINFGNSVITNLPDLFTEVVSTAHRIGEDNLMIINYQNIGTATAKDVAVELTLPSEIEVLLSSLPYAVAKAADASLEFVIGDLVPNQKGQIFVSYTLGLLTPIGTEIAVEAKISNGAPEISDTNNSSVDKSQAVASFDPNDIAVSPARFVKKDEWLHYKIRFQNVGNIPASLVRVEDELPVGLDLSTLELGGVSHTYKLQVDGRKLTWTFPNINLADSLSNEKESHGYITFRIKPKEDLSIGDRMMNRAAIYFDNLQPVLTNTVENVLIGEIAKESKAFAKPLQIQPNPTSGNVTVQSLDMSLESDAFFVEIRLFDQFGRQVYQAKNVATQRQELYLYHLSTGTYHIKAVDSKGRAYAGKISLMRD